MDFLLNHSDEEGEKDSIFSLLMIKILIEKEYEKRGNKI
jgi:hypothetical protein